MMAHLKEESEKINEVMFMYTNDFKGNKTGYGKLNYKNS